MAAQNDTASMALFCDFENIALGVRDAQYDKFDIRPVLERLLAKGSIVVKKAYCDWDRYKTFKASMHEANFELIEIPHVRQSGKNSADIRMVVDALDLCYTKAHVDTFVIISGDSDFSPLVSKLRENAKKVIGVGVKQSCSDLLVTNCDEFIYYDDLVRDRESERTVQRREREKRSPEDEAKRREKQEERKRKAIDIVSSTFVDLIADRGDGERIWASVLKEVVKRRNPGFNENYYGFRTFGNLLEEAANRGLLGFGRDEKGAYVFRAPLRQGLAENDLAPVEPVAESPAENVAVAVDPAQQPEMPVQETAAEVASKGNGRRRNMRGRRRNTEETANKAETLPEPVVQNEPALQPELALQPEPETPVGVALETASVEMTPAAPALSAIPEAVESVAPIAQVEAAEPLSAEPLSTSVEASESAVVVETAPPVKPRRQGGRRPGKKAAAAAGETAELVEVAPLVSEPPVTPEPEEIVASAPAEEAPAAKRKPARRKSTSASTRTRKPKADEAA